VAAMAPNQRLSGRQYGWGVLGLCLFSAVAIVGGLSHPDWFPRTFVAGMGLTTFKVVCEYVLALVYIAAATRLVGRYKREGDANDLKLALAAWILALSGVLLTLYGDTTDLFNLLGHVAKAVAYVLIYNALFVSGVRVPYVALSQERALLRTLMDSIPDLIFFKDRSSRYLGYNKAFAAYCGRPEEEMAGKTDDEFVAPQIAEFYREKDREAMAAAQPSCNEEWIDYPDGRHVLLETIKSRFFAPDGALLGLIGISRDITERNLAEARLRRAHHELEMVTYVASHDLQEPVRTVASFLQLLKLRYGGKLGEDADQYIDYAVAGVHRMREQLTGLLEFSRVGHSVASFRPTDMDTVLAEVMAGFDTALSEMGAVVVHDHLPVVMADAAQMRSLLQNLIANAIKYHSSERNLEIHVTATQMGSEWRFTVRDNGIGIAREYWEKIFEIFQRLHTLDRYEGTGIGLAICRKIVDRHGGRIWVDSIPGQGSSFTFSLPIRS
ncbi:MAG: PAS domain-containing protein, partial [Magnetospirillum sp.]|nr:PAS domain-containing protein [Magnetospirillum sp.]